MKRKRKEKKGKRPGWSLFFACLHAAAAIKSKNGTCVCVRARVYGGVLHDASLDLPEVALDTNLFYGRTSDRYFLLFQEKQLVGETSFVPPSLNPVREKVQVRLDPALKVLIHCFDED
jgi:hypothetical protein